jgi:flagellar basal-body rod modification protein FlgD
MSIVAPVDSDGNLITQLNSTSDTTSSSSGTDLDKEAFLTLLVAQMQYQDPLEPMDNTEYVSQLATFSQLEELQNMSTTLTNGQAADLAGKTVIVNVTDASGETSQKAGVVDYVVYKNGTPYLVINEEEYAYSALDSVVSDTYLEKIQDSQMASAVTSYIDDLPEVGDAKLDVYDKVMLAASAYESLTESQKSYVDESYVTKLQDLVSLMEKLKENSSQA